MYYQRDYIGSVYLHSKIVKGIFRAVRDDFILDAGGSSAGPAN